MMGVQERGDRDESVRFDVSGSDVQVEDVIEYLMDREDIDSNNILCVQKTSDGAFAVAFADGSCHAVLLADPEVSVRGVDVMLSKADQQLVKVRLQYLPFEVSHTQVSDEMSQFGTVFSCVDVSYSGYPAIKSGVRLLKMSIADDIPSYVLLAGYQVRVTYRGQTPTCRRCGREGHHANACSNIKCFRCKEIGHRAADCQVPVKCFKCGLSGHTAWRCSANMSSQESVPVVAEVIDESSQEPVPVVSDSQMVVAGEVAEVIDELVDSHLTSSSVPSCSADWGDRMVVDDVFKEQERKDVLANEMSEKCAREKEACERAEMELRKKQMAEKDELERLEKVRLKELERKHLQQEKEKQAKQDKQEKQRLREKQARFKEQEKKRVDVSGFTKESLTEWRQFGAREYVEGGVAVVISESGTATVLTPKSVPMERQVWISLPNGFVHQSRLDFAA